jgi:NADPH-dependent glutamate synthase beta subunit-like oxidoreductase
MALLKKDKVKPVIRSAHQSGVETSPLRPYLQPKQAPCMDKCPQGTEIRRILMLIAQAKKYGRPQEEAFENAWRILTEKNPIPAVCGRVCPHPCEAACNRKDKDGALGINSIERFLGDWALERGLDLHKLKSQDKDEAFSEKIAVISSGPAGLSCAYQLARRGYTVTIFEAFPQAGGMLRYGIPSDRLPRQVLDAEIDRIVRAGVSLRTNTAVGKDISYEQVCAEYDAIFIGIGANATLLYRRTRDEMPAIGEEIVGAEEESVEFYSLAIPIEIVKENDRAIAARCQDLKLRELDEPERRRPLPIALFQGRQAAESIHRRFRGLEKETAPALPIIRSDRVMLQWYPEALRYQAATLGTGERLAKPWDESIPTLTESETIAEAQRCMSCGSCFDCGSCWSLCQDQAIIKPVTPGEPYRIKLEFCKGCNKCKENCPCGLIEMR